MRIVLVLIGIVLWSACETPEQVVAETSDGIWQQEGYGRIIQLQDTLVTIYDYCKVDCSLASSEHLLDFGELLKVEKDHLIIKHGIDQWQFKRLAKLPDYCHTDETKSPDQVNYNFEVFWNTFNENYCSFEIKGVNWQEVYAKQKSKLDTATTNAELFVQFSEMMELLDDGHVKMEVPEELKDDTAFVSKSSRQFNFLDELKIGEQIISNYVKNHQEKNNGILRWGMIGNTNVAYVQINSMLMQADYGLAETPSFRDFFGAYWAQAATRKDEEQRADEREGLGKTMDQMIDELAQAKYFIVDLRFNGGGKDGVALEIINHFTAKEQVVFTKKVKHQDEFLNLQRIATNPSPHRFTGEVYLITSARTASASEVLVLASLPLEHFTRVGATTEGIFSSTLDKVLPNGWEYEFSNEIYQDLAGNNYEGKGIEPDYPIDYPRDSDAFIGGLYQELETGKDSAIEKILSLIKE